MQSYRLCSFLSLYLRSKEKEMNQRKRKHANVPSISLTLNAKILFELPAQILSRLTIALRARSPDLYHMRHCEELATKQSIDRGQAPPSAMTCGWQDVREPVIAHLLRDLFHGLLRLRSQ